MLYLHHHHHHHMEQVVISVKKRKVPQLDGWVVVGWDEVAISEFLLTTRCANSVNVVSKGNLGRHMKTYHCVPIRFWAFLGKPQDGATIQRFKEAREEISFWRTGSMFRAFLLKLFQRNSEAIFQPESTIIWGKDTDISSQTLNKMFPRDSQCQWTAIDVI